MILGELNEHCTAVTAGLSPWNVLSFASRALRKQIVNRLAREKTFEKLVELLEILLSFYFDKVIRSVSLDGKASVTKVSRPFETHSGNLLFRGVKILPWLYLLQRSRIRLRKDMARCGSCKSASSVGSMSKRAQETRLNTDYSSRGYIDFVARRHSSAEVRTH